MEFCGRKRNEVLQIKNYLVKDSNSFKIRLTAVLSLSFETLDSLLSWFHRSGYIDVQFASFKVVLIEHFDSFLGFVVA